MLRFLSRLCPCCLGASAPVATLEAEGDGYFVSGAGVKAVCGKFRRRADLKDGVPCFENELGVLLFRYRLRASGVRYWYLSDGNADLDTSAGDFYRVRSADVRPPLRGWAGCSWADDGALPQLVYVEDVNTYEPDPLPAAEERDAATSAFEGDKNSCDLEQPSQEIVVMLLSGAVLATVSVAPSWTGLRVKMSLGPFLQDGTVVTKLVVGGLVFENAQTVQDLGLQPGATVNAIVQACDYVVEDAGIREVNGHYINTNEDMNGAPSFRNEYGTLLFRYIFRSSGSSFWYFSDDSKGDLNKSHGDYYRVKTAELLPPLSGWTRDKCPLGLNPCPTIRQPNHAPVAGSSCEAE